jgi:hypothetical protein
MNSLQEASDGPPSPSEPSSRCACKGCYYCVCCSSSDASLEVRSDTLLADPNDARLTPTNSRRPLITP